MEFGRPTSNSRRTTQRGGSSVFFLIVLAGATAFVWLTSRALPDVVASHFVMSGVANGFMPRALYVRFMLVFVVALPSVLAFLPALGLNSPRARINLPNREYWLAPDRRADTIRFLREHMVRGAALLVVFLSYVHWLVVRANMAVPPNLPAPWFIGGLIVFVLSMLIWAGLLIWHFRNVPR
jgi:uncharacterized membrane protein